MNISYGYELAGYYCLLDEMYVQGIINSRAFSLDLGNVDEAAGKYFNPSMRRCLRGQAQFSLAELTRRNSRAPSKNVRSSPRAATPMDTFGKRTLFLS